ncbi:hypothetical protein OUZ56_030104 [Daphnia magna]|uniref:CCHC-type domain-containing protein n=1 Tax=Daphnia magna TaxID=35525 RepID=A0ABQ9ZRK2_9CRUS|nr:hypothetical protein OUZ56_030104 [Daphnia magna]
MQYLLKYVGYDTAEWTDSSNCTNCRAATVDQAGPSDDYGEVEQDGEALLYCEALLASEASPSGMGNPAEEGGQPTDESAVDPPAIEHAAPLEKQALGLMSEGFRLLGPLLGQLGNQGPCQQQLQPKQKAKRRRSDLNKMKTRKCNKCQQKGHYQRDCPY